MKNNMNKKELEKMFDEEFDELLKIDRWERGYDELDVTDEVKQFIFKTIIPEVLNSVLPEWNKKSYISTYKNYIKPKIKELYNIDL